MSISLYYTAKRKHSISKQEQDTCQKVVEDYIAKYPFIVLFRFVRYIKQKKTEKGTCNV